MVRHRAAPPADSGDMPIIVARPARPPTIGPGFSADHVMHPPQRADRRLLPRTVGSAILAISPTMAVKEWYWSAARIPGQGSLSPAGCGQGEATRRQAAAS